MTPSVHGVAGLIMIAVAPSPPTANTGLVCRGHPLTPVCSSVCRTALRFVVHGLPWGSRAQAGCTALHGLSLPVVNVDEAEQRCCEDQPSLAMEGASPRGGSGVSDTGAVNTPAPPR
jgi:hypothetical protein